jgi:hypothetical protein
VCRQVDGRDKAGALRMAAVGGPPSWGTPVRSSRGAGPPIRWSTRPAMVWWAGVPFGSASSPTLDRGFSGAARGTQQWQSVVGGGGQADGWRRCGSRVGGCGTAHGWVAAGGSVGGGDAARRRVAAVRLVSGRRREGQWVAAVRQLVRVTRGRDLGS